MKISALEHIDPYPNNRDRKIARKPSKNPKNQFSNENILEHRTR